MQKQQFNDSKSFKLKRYVSMIQTYIQLIVLFLVIFDPLASLSVFVSSTNKKSKHEQHRIAIISVIVAGLISLVVLLLGTTLLDLFSTTIDDFKIAGGIILILLGINMVLGKSIVEESVMKESSAPAIAAIIGSPILAGPASITTIIISVHEYGQLDTGIAIIVVLIITGLIFWFGADIHSRLGDTFEKVMSAVLGLVTISWGVKFIREVISKLFL